MTRKISRDRHSGIPPFKERRVGHPPQWPGRLLPFAGFLFRSRVEKKLAHLAGHIAGDGSLLRPCQRLVQISAFQYPKTAHVLLGLGVRPVGDEHLTVGLGPQRLRAASRGNAAGELPHAGSNHFAVERVDLLDHRFGYGGRVEVVGEVVSNQILWHDFSLFSVVCFLSLRAVAHRSVAYSRSGDQKSTATPIFISAAESALAGTAAPVPVGSAPAPPHKKPGPQRSCRACGTYPHGLNAPGNNLPIRHVPAAG